MYYSVADIGSNTVRLVVYDVCGGVMTPVKNECRALMLVSKLKDGVLPDEEIEKLCETVDTFRKISPQGAKFIAFATAFIRETANSKQITDAVFLKTGVRITILSGSEEARYSFNGIISGTDAANGVAVDLGGGSCEFIRFEDRKSSESASLPFGCVRLAQKFFRDSSSPSDEELENVRSYVYGEVSSLVWAQGAETVVMTGGTARAAAQISRFINGETAPVGGYRFTREAFDGVYAGFTGAKEKYSYFIDTVMPERKLTVYPGLAAMKAIFDRIGCTDIRISTEGVREGVLSELIGRE